MAQPDWAPERRTGESRKDYQARYYTAQRESDMRKARGGDVGAAQEYRQIYNKLSTPGRQKAEGYRAKLERASTRRSK